MELPWIRLLQPLKTCTRRILCIHSEVRPQMMSKQLWDWVSSLSNQYIILLDNAGHLGESEDILAFLPNHHSYKVQLSDRNPRQERNNRRKNSFIHPFICPFTLQVLNECLLYAGCWTCQCRRFRFNVFTSSFVLVQHCRDFQNILSKSVRLQRSMCGSNTLTKIYLQNTKC